MTDRPVDDLTLKPNQPLTALLDRLGPGGGSAQMDEAGSWRHVHQVTRSHDENFSVLSALVPADLRDDFAAVYAFCRWADDLADEVGGDADSSAVSLGLLAWWRDQLRRCYLLAGRDPDEPPGSPDGPLHPVFVALGSTVRRHGVPIEPMLHLIDAFEQDQRVKAYGTWDELLGYCARSADPVGRIVLHLGGYPETPANAERYRLSDLTCSALQLINFWQDVRRDLLDRDRVYLPFEMCGLTAGELRAMASRPDDPATRIRFIRAVRPLVERTRAMFEEARGLARRVGPRLGPVVWLFHAGGYSTLRRVESIGCTTLWTRPTLPRHAKAMLVARAWLWSHAGRFRGREW